MAIVATVIAVPNPIIPPFSPKSWKSKTIIFKKSPSLIIANSKSSSSSSSSEEEEEEGMMKIKYEGTRRREKALTEMIELKIKEAEMVCEEDGRSDGCKVAWDEVEEISEAKANLRLQLMQFGDPLHRFCMDHPEMEECRIDED